MKPVDLREHQRKAVSRLHNGAILTGGVGTGKSRVALQYYVEKESPKDVYVITTAKKRDSGDWESEAVLHGIGILADATFHGRIIVDSWNNLSRYVDVESAFFIFDEQRLVGSGAWVKSFYKVAKKNRWILLSATPGDTWLDYIPVLVANGHYKNRTEFLREHVVYSRFSKFPKVERFIAVNRLVKLRNSILVDMPYERHTTRHVESITVDYDLELAKKVTEERWHVYENRPLRDVAELFSVMRKVVNSDASRLEMVRDLCRTHPKVIVFYNFDYELEILRTLSSNLMTRQSNNLDSLLIDTNQEIISSSKQTSSVRLGNLFVESKPLKTNSAFTVAEWNGHKHEPIPETDSWVYLVQYLAGAEGWNCIQTDAMVFFSLTYSYRQFEQGQGRIDRLDTPFDDLWYYVFRSNSWIDKAIWKALLRKENFNEKRAISEVPKNLGKATL